MRADLGKGNHAVDMKIFEASNRKIADRVWKDAQDKHGMKEAMKSMAQYINAILHPKPEPLNEMSAMVDVSSSTNQQFLDNLQKCKVVAKTSEEWLQYILKKNEEQIRLLDKASKETIVTVKKVESNNEGFQKERSNWVKVVLWIEEI